MSPVDAKEFILGGHSLFTVSNGRGSHFGYRVDRKQGRGGLVYFLSLASRLIGGQDSAYLGLLDPRSGKVVRTAKSRLPESDPAFIAISWALRLTWAGRLLPAPADLLHAGKCGRCGRVLTHPDSLRTGLGPECRRAS